MRVEDEGELTPRAAEPHERGPENEPEGGSPANSLVASGRPVRMIELTRRRAIRTAGAAGLTALAGCADGGDDPATTEPQAENTDPTMTEDPDTETETGTGEFETERHQVGRALTGPSWDREETPGFCTLVEERSDADELLDDADEATRSFVEATDFDSSVILYVESVGPNGCYDEIEVSDLGVDDEGLLTGNAAAVDTSAPDVACQQVITYPAVMLRITADPRPRRATLRVFDGWGRSAPVSAGDEGTQNGLGSVDSMDR